MIEQMIIIHLLIFYLERNETYVMKTFEELIEELVRISDYHDEIINYILDVDNIDNFETVEELNERYEEVEVMIKEGEIL